VAVQVLNLNSYDLAKAALDPFDMPMSIPIALTNTMALSPRWVGLLGALPRINFPVTKTRPEPYSELAERPSSSPREA